MTTSLADYVRELIKIHKGSYMERLEIRTADYLQKKHPSWSREKALAAARHAILRAVRS